MSNKVLSAYVLTAAALAASGAFPPGKMWCKNMSGDPGRPKGRKMGDSPHFKVRKRKK